MPRTTHTELGSPDPASRAIPDSTAPEHFPVEVRKVACEREKELGTPKQMAQSLGKKNRD